MNPLDILKDAKKWQKSMGDFQKVIENVTATGRSGGGMVEVDMNGHMDIVDVRIDPVILKPENAEMVEELIVSAAGDATAKIRNAMTSEMGSLVTGLTNGN